MMKSFTMKLSILSIFFLFSGILINGKKCYAANYETDILSECTFTTEISTYTNDYEADILSESAFTNEILVYTTDYATDTLSKDALQRLISEPIITADSNTVNALKSQIHLDGNTALFCTNDTPENVATLMSSRSSDYKIVPYSLTKTYYTKNFWGIQKKFLTIKVSGEVFIYKDGKVHLYSVNMSSTSHQTGWTISYETNGILNTDGSLSSCIYYVYCKSSSKEYKFGCWLTIYKYDNYPSISIEQIY